MALKAKTKKKIVAKLKEFEGSVPHLYLDTKGYVTVGIGHLVASRDDMASVIMYTVVNKLPSSLATTAAKKTEYDTIKKEKKGKRASAYKSKTTLIMKEQDILDQKTKHVDAFYVNLKEYYKVTRGFKRNFDDFPENVQLALFDMIFNLGYKGLKTKFPSFNRAIKAEDWRKAAKECNRPDVSVTRNNYVKKLFKTVPIVTVPTPTIKPVVPFKTAPISAPLMPNRSN